MDNKLIGKSMIKEIAHGLVGNDGDLFFRITEYMEEHDIPYTAEDYEAIFDDVITSIQHYDY